MTESRTHTTKLFNSAIYSFMPRQYLFSLTNRISNGKVKIIRIVVTTIYHNLFSWSESFPNCISSKSKIWPFAARKAAMSLNNVSSANTNSSFITQTGTVEFVWLPFGIKLCWFHNSKVSSIKRNKCGCIYWSISKTLLPVKLKFLEISESFRFQFQVSGY